MKYAATVGNPYEMEIIEKLILRIGLHSQCEMSDVMECADRVHTMADNLHPVVVVHQYNSQCQQFFGTVTSPNFYSSDESHNKLSA